MGGRMSDQETGHGHQVTTMHAVRHVFERIPSEQLLGQTPQQFFEKLNAAQAKADGMPGTNAATRTPSSSTSARPLTASKTVIAALTCSETQLAPEIPKLRSRLCSILPHSASCPGTLMKGRSTRCPQLPRTTTSHAGRTRLEQRLWARFSPSTFRPRTHPTIERRTRLTATLFIRSSR